MVETVPKGTEMCNITTFPYQDIIFVSQQNVWTKVMLRNKTKSQDQKYDNFNFKARTHSPPYNALFCAEFYSDDQKVT
jgi:hypothetical protein